MSNYSEKYSQLSSLRQEKQQLSSELLQKREQLRRTTEQIRQLSRTKTPDDPKIAELKSREQELSGLVAETKHQYLSRKTSELNILNEYKVILNPEEQINGMSGNYPILMMPVRIETVFHTSGTTGAEKDELWVRFFPDDVFVETHEGGLTPEELEDAKNYWIEYWRAGGSREKQLAAWRAVCRSYGAYRAAYFTRRTKPVNQTQQPTSPLEEDESLPVSPDFPEVELKEDAWNEAPKVTALPDYFVCMGYHNDIKEVQEIGNPITDPLIVGPDPALEAEEGMRQEDDKLIVDDDMQWMVDFEEAIRMGMGMKIPLTPLQAANGFDRLVVVGIRFSLDEQQGKEKLEHLLVNHHYAEDGFSFIPQGTPTNNTGDGKSGFSSFSLDEEAIFDVEHAEQQFDASAEDWKNKADGLLFSQYMGINPDILQHIQHSGTFDNRDAKAMNTALWPATLGYFLEEMMDPLLSERDIRSTEYFFKKYITGRSILPAIRIGNQPYGLLPVTSFKNLHFTSDNTTFNEDSASYGETSRIVNLFMNKLYSLINKLDDDWEEMVQQVSYVGKNDGDPHQHLLDVLGLHATSVDYYHRYSSGAQYYTNYLNMAATNTASVDWYIKLELKIRELQQELGLRWKEPPAILKKLFYQKNTHLNGPVIDDQPLSEEKTIRGYSSSNENYIEWMIRNSLDVITQQDFGEDKKAPNALLYLMLRHATMQVYNDTSNNLLKAVNPEYSKPVETNEFMYLGEAPAVSKFRYLYDYNTQVTEGENVLVGDYISNYVNNYAIHPDITIKPNTREIIELVDALNILKDLPTAALERVFAEHIDLCSYRLDAWKQGFTNVLLDKIRFRRDTGENEASLKQGIYLGAYGWLVDVKPTAKLQEKEKTEVPEEFREVNKIFTNEKNGGYVHAPSLNHAVTASVIRNAYLSHAEEDDADKFAVNLSSERVKVALDLIDGIRNGQELGALLGYRFERRLHDKHNIAELDKFIYPLRKKFPLVADKLTPSSDDTSIEAVEARNVLNGVDLLEHIEKEGEKSYPFGFSDLPSASNNELDAINAEVERIADAMDAVSDLALSEGVFQVVRGNYDRGGAMLQAISEGNNPPEPEIVNTPRSGYAINQRVGLHFETGIDYTTPATANPFDSRISYSPRARGEAGLNKWLSGILPDPADVKVLVEHPASISDNTPTETDLSQEQLDLQPIDLLFVCNREMENEQTELDARIAYKIKQTIGLTDEASIVIKYTQRKTDWTSDTISFFELMPLVENVKALLTKSRPLSAEDMFLPTEGHEMGDNPKNFDVAEIKTRAEHLVDLYENTHLKALKDAHNDITTNPPTATHFNNLRQALLDINGYGIPEAMPLIIDDNYDELVALAERVINKAQEKLDRYNATVLTTGNDQEIAVSYKNATRHLFEDDFVVIPNFNLHNATEWDKTYTDHAALIQHHSSDFPMDEWMNSLAKVRQPMKHIHQVNQYADVFQTNTPELLPMQLPYIESDKWLGLEYGEYSIDTDKLLYSFHYNGSWHAGSSQAGLLIDDWVDVVPTENETTGLSFNYNKPNAEAPQTLLLAVSPEIEGEWKWEHLEAILNETLDNAKKRAVEPDIINDTGYAQFLPAIMVTVTRHLITISTNLAMNNVTVYNTVSNED